LVVKPYSLKFVCTTAEWLAFVAGMEAGDFPEEEEHEKPRKKKPEEYELPRRRCVSNAPHFVTGLGRDFPVLRMQ
jgi:hypothetical protein